MNLETKITIYKFTPQVFTLTHFKISVNRCIFASCTKIYEISKIGQSYICINSIYLQII